MAPADSAVIFFCFYFSSELTADCSREGGRGFRSFPIFLVTVGGIVDAWERAIQLRAWDCSRKPNGTSHPGMISLEGLLWFKTCELGQQSPLTVFEIAQGC